MNTPYNIYRSWRHYIFPKKLLYAFFTARELTLNYKERTLIHFYQHSFIEYIFYASSLQQNVIIIGNI